jgi:hypothetical protein
MKTLAKTFGTLESMCVAIAKHMQHLDENLQRTYETLETNTCIMHVMQHSDVLMEYSDETLETYV